MDTTYIADPLTAGIGLLVARLVLGLLMAAHGSQKLLGWFGGLGFKTTGEHFVHLGFRPGWIFAAAASLGEVVSGLLVAPGIFGPVGPALMLAVMIVAIITVHWPNGLFTAANGIELPLLYATGALGLALVGFGPYSLDALLGIESAWTPGITWAVLAAGVIGGIANLALRRPPAPARSA